MIRSAGFGPFRQRGTGQRPHYESSRLAQSLRQAKAAFVEGRQVGQGYHIRTVAERLVGTWVRLDEEAVAATGDGGLGEKRDHAALAVRPVSLSRRFLYAVGRVKDHG